MANLASNLASSINIHDIFQIGVQGIVFSPFELKYWAMTPALPEAVFLPWGEMPHLVETMKLSGKEQT